MALRKTHDLLHTHQKITKKQATRVYIVKKRGAKRDKHEQYNLPDDVPKLAEVTLRLAVRNMCCSVYSTVKPDNSKFHCEIPVTLPGHFQGDGGRLHVGKFAKGVE